MSQNQSASLDFDEGRYLYCAIRTEDGLALDVEGIEDGEVRIIEEDHVQRKDGSLALASTSIAG